MAVRVGSVPFALVWTRDLGARPAPDWAPLTIHDIQGRLVRVLTCVAGGACPQVAGPYHGEWNGTDSHGHDVPSGIYFLRYVGRTGTVIKRIAITR